jgi:hypothetical protein
MEARVDVRKLQILNDRINQTIDALNQVRLSVHGLGHSPVQNPIGFAGPGYGPQQGFGMQSPLGGQSPYQGLGGQNPYQGPGGQLGQLSSQLNQQQGIPGLGFQHSPFQQFQNPFVNPYLSQQGMMSPWGQSPVSGSPWGGVGGVAGGSGGGIFPSSPDVIDRQIAEVKASDPYRISQTFPFVTP